MARRKGDKNASGKGTAANLGFEAQLWQAADKVRNNLEAAEYKHVVLGFFVPECISDAFEEQHAKLGAEKFNGAPSNSRLLFDLCLDRFTKILTNPAPWRPSAMPCCRSRFRAKSASRTRRSF